MTQANNNSDQKSREMASTDNDIVVFLRILLIQFLWIIPNYLINNTRSTFGSTFDLQIASNPIDTYIGMWFKLQSYGCHACVSKSCYKPQFLRIWNDMTNESSHHSKFSELQYKKYVWSWNCLRPNRSWLHLRGSNLQFFDLLTCHSVLSHTIHNILCSNNFRAELMLKNT